MDFSLLVSNGMKMIYYDKLGGIFFSEGGDVRMGSQRQYIRVKDDSKCILMELDGSTYEALLEDISLGGALIKVSNGVPKSLNVGDKCNLMLCSNPDVCPSKLSCRVVRHDSVNMGIRFLSTRVQ